MQFKLHSNMNQVNDEKVCYQSTEAESMGGCSSCFLMIVNNILKQKLVRESL